MSTLHAKSEGCQENATSRFHQPRSPVGRQVSIKKIKVQNHNLTFHEILIGSNIGILVMACYDPYNCVSSRQFSTVAEWWEKNSGKNRGKFPTPVFQNPPVIPFEEV